MASVWPAHDRMDFSGFNPEMASYYATEWADGQRRSGRMRWRSQRLRESMDLLVDAYLDRCRGIWNRQWDRITYGPWAEQVWAASQAPRP